ncbi:MAG TPA: hypothetical protein VGP93_04115 [Polyangiaceae bacterium]|nr:hypothetical protein [Polyangiaceae bacterium]
MNDDLLNEAVRALRDEGQAEEAGSKFTRARVMASLHQGTVSRRTRVALLLPIAATFVAASAFGLGTERGRAVVRRAQESLGFVVAPAAPSALGAETKKSASRLPPKPVTTTEPAAPAAELEPELDKATPITTAPVRLSPSSSSARIEAELEFYRAAHRAHFIDRDPERALAAWDTYLARAPHGQFVLEARYNRALCLVRLGRKEQARAALEPFARGDYNGYRKREAGELLDTLPN